MDRTEFVMLLEPLVLALRATMDAPTWTAYFRALSDVPVRWLSAAVDAALREDRAFMPAPGELRALADHAMAQARAQLTPGECEDCDNTRWAEAPDADGVPRVSRCGCWQRYQVAVAELSTLPASAPRRLAELN